MSLPREILPHRTYMITRRCTQRTFLLRPDTQTTQTFLYCLALAAERHGIEVLSSVVMSNHHHTIIYDQDGTVAKFCEYLHGLVGRAMNCLRGRWENLWAKEPTSLVRLVDVSDVLDKMAYVATNPVKDHLVEHAEQWPGLSTTNAFFQGRALTAARPAHFFRATGELPETATLTLGWPAHLGSVAAARQALRERIDVIEGRARQERTSKGLTVLGWVAARRQDFNSRPRTQEPRRRLRPTIAARNVWARVEALLRNRAFLEAYRAARARWVAGLAAVFPPGTYGMRRVPGVVVLE